MKATSTTHLPAHVQFTDIGPEDPRLASDILPMPGELRPHLTPQSRKAIYSECQGLRFTGACVAGACVGVAGWRIVATTFCGRKLTIDDLVVGTAARSNGIGHALLAELQQRARAAGCQLLDLDSATHRTDAHRFYTRERMSIPASHFVMES